ncbi:hypothetical protein [Variovorax sp. AFSI2.2]|uniref:hypothetical protein n=1 Tax=Variovorax sp. AFSI2.2 TaxID=3384160 RepID=UPI003EBE12E7
MATIPPGGIVTIPDPTSGGAGAPVTTTQIINAMWANAQSKSESGDLRIGQAIGFADPAPHVLTPTLDTTYLPPLKPDLPPDSPNDAEAMYNTQRDQMINLITDSWADFISTYFPNPGFYNDALAWCHTAFTSGGSGLSPVVEQQLWERARARILADSQRAEDEATATWANRRWPVPPGALTNQINQIRLDAGRKLAEQSRDISIKSFDTEIENVRFAVKQVLDQRKVALDATGDYIKTIMLGPQTAMSLATGLANIRSEASRALVALYSAESAALQPRVQLAIADADLKMRGEQANLQAQMNSLESKVRAAIAGAQLVGQQAAAGLNAINSSASISGSDTTNT